MTHRWALLALFIAGCSSGGGGQAAAPPVLSTITGFIIKDAVDDATTGVYDMLATGGRGDVCRGDGRSLPDGRINYDFEHGGGGEKTFVCQATGGSFRHTATGLTTTLGNFPLSVIFCIGANRTATVTATILSTMVFQRTRMLMVLRFLTLKQALLIAKAQIAAFWGLASVDVMPDINGTVDQQRAALLDLAFAQWAVTLGIPLMELVTLFCLDMMDGRLDGFGCGKRLVSEGLVQLPINPMAGLLAALVFFLDQNPLNTTGLLSTSAVVVAFAVVFAAVVLPRLPRILAVDPPYAKPGDTVRIYRDGDEPAPFVQFEDDGGTVHDVLDPIVENGCITITVPDDADDGPATVLLCEGGQCDAAKFQVNSFQLECDTFGFLSPRAGGGVATGCVPGADLTPVNPPVVRVGQNQAEVYRVLSSNAVQYFVPPGTGQQPVTVNGESAGDVSYFGDGGSVFSDGFGDDGLSLVTLTEEEDPAELVFLGQLLEDGGDSVDGNGGAVTHDELGTTFEVTSGQGTTAGPPDGLTGSIVFDNDTAVDLAIGTPGGAPGILGNPNVIIDTNAQTAGDRLGFAYAVPRPTRRPVPGGKYYVTALCFGFNEQEERETSSFYGKACFDDAAGKVFFAGILTSRNEETVEVSVTPLFSSACYTIDNKGAITLSAFDPDSGITFGRGVMEEGARHGSAVVGGPRKIAQILFAQCQPNITVHEPVTLTGACMRHDGVDTFATQTDLLVSHNDGLLQVLRCDRDRRLMRSENGALPPRETLSAEGLFMNPAGVCVDKNGRKVALVCVDGIMLMIPRLPYEGTGELETVGEEGLGFGCCFPVPTRFSNRSMPPPCEYKVIAQGVEVAPFEGFLSPFLKGTVGLGCATPEPPGGVEVCDQPIDLVSTFTFETLKRTISMRDESNEVTLSNDTNVPAEGYAYAFIGNRLVVFEQPLGDDATACILKGGLSADGSCATLRSVPGFGAAWCAKLVKKSTTPPVVDGCYDLRYFCIQMDGDTGTAFTTNGTGTFTFDGAGGTFSRTTRQTSFDDACNRIDAPDATFPGTFTVDADGCYNSITDFGGGFLFPHCGMVTDDGSRIYFIGGGNSCLFVASRKDAPAPPPLTGQLPFCGIAVDFDGAGGLFVYSRAGRACFDTTTASVAIEEICYGNTLTQWTRTFNFYRDVPIAYGPNRMYTVSLEPGLDLVGEQSDGDPRKGTQAEAGINARKGSFDLTGPFADKPQ